LGVLAIVTIVIAWVIGGTLAEERMMPYLESVVPDADLFLPMDGTTYKAIVEESKETIIAYVTVAQTMGYGGPMKMAVATNMEGEVLGITIADHDQLMTIHKVARPVYPVCQKQIHFRNLNKTVDKS
jgi:Na+-translocating ferredoxin:NAD+ oxidoreductase RnfG subunit